MIRSSGDLKLKPFTTEIAEDAEKTNSTKNQFNDFLCDLGVLGGYWFFRSSDGPIIRSPDELSSHSRRQLKFAQQLLELRQLGRDGLLLLVLVD